MNFSTAYNIYTETGANGADKLHSSVENNLMTFDAYLVDSYGLYVRKVSATSSNSNV